ncbi:efflux RND transporter periplasmic adaptor subunit [Candidatus Fermentibacteria bacterium]|nr:efflux RND transporter periplasmic adaptor subunit [Candidatus Fermentibacteria bacterium]
MKKRWIVIGVVGLVVVSSISQAVVKGKGKAVKVRTETAACRTLVSEVSGPARVRPSTEVKLSADAMGRVTAIAVKEGERVTRGQFLLQLDPVQYEAQVNRSRAELDQARAALEQSAAQLRQGREELERLQRLFEKDLVSPEVLDRQKTQVEVLAAQRTAATRNVTRADAVLASATDILSRTTFLSPMDGTVSKVNVEEGEMAVVGTMNNPGTVLIQIAAMDTMEAEVEVDETEVVDMRLGLAARVELDAFPDTSLKAVVTSVSSSATIKNRGTPQEVTVFPVVVLLTESFAGVRPGMTGTARIETARRDSVLSVPISSLVVRDPEKEERKERGEKEPEVNPDRKPPEQEGVYTVVNRKARFRPLETGISGEQYVEVHGGLDPDATVIIGPFETLRDLRAGTKVKITKEAKK